MKKSGSLLLVVVFLFLISCKKNQLGGKASISGTVVHHHKAIAHASVFIKFNATEFPGADTLAYDSKMMADENGHFSFSCYKGKYYLYSVGIDYALPISNNSVKGGLGIKVRMNEDVDIELAVTED